MDDAAPLAALLTLSRGGALRVGRERIVLLQAVGDHGSISAAAKVVGLSYKAAWDAVQALNNLFAQPLIAPHAGGRSGGASILTPAGQAVIAAFHAVETELAEAAERLSRRLAGLDTDTVVDPLLWSMTMKTSARNALRGVVSRVTTGAVNVEVTLRIAEDVDIVAVVTRESVEQLGLAPGRTALALIKSSMVIVAEGHGPLRTSARNSLAGVVVHREDGAVNSEVTLELTTGKTLTTTLTRESADALALAPGVLATALIKASHVILATE